MLSKLKTIFCLERNHKESKKKPGVWFTRVISALRKLRQEDHKFIVRLTYISRPYLKKTRAGYVSKCLSSTHRALVQTMKTNKQTAP
jgi:hypothetical protein